MNTATSEIVSAQLTAADRTSDSDDKRGVLQALISPERAKAFDRLFCLLPNLYDAVVVCGPDGIGKTTLLRLIESQADEPMTVCFLESSPTLDFQHIQDKLLSALGAAEPTALGENRERVLIDRLDRLQQNQRSVILLLDDAGLLPPGLLTAVCQFAVVHSALRPVFAMTSDDLHIKCSTDPIIDNGYIADIPPLSEQQCGEHLKNLSGKPDSLIQFKAITPSMIQKVYHDTHGIPGRIVAMLPRINEMKIDPIAPKAVPIESVLVGIAVVIGGLIWFFSSQDVGGGGISQANRTASIQEHRPVQLPAAETLGDARQEKATPVVARPNARNTKETEASPSADGPMGPTPETAEGYAATDVALQTEPSSMASDTAGGKLNLEGVSQENRPAVPDSEVTRRSAVDRPDGPNDGPADDDTVDEPAEAAHVSEAPSIAGVKEAKWLLARNPDRYTLQLLAVREWDALQKFVARHPELRDLAFFRFQRDGVTWHALLYGDFPSIKAARRAAKALPSSLRVPWPRKLKSVQTQIRSKGN